MQSKRQERQLKVVFPLVAPVVKRQISDADQQEEQEKGMHHKYLKSNNNNKSTKQDKTSKNKQIKKNSQKNSPENLQAVNLTLVEWLKGKLYCALHLP